MTAHDARLARRLAQVSQLSGSFVLRSGLTADTYFDKYQFESDPELLTAVAKRMAERVPAGIALLAGLESA